MSHPSVPEYSWSWPVESPRFSRRSHTTTVRVPIPQYRPGFRTKRSHSTRTTHLLFWLGFYPSLPRLTLFLYNLSPNMTLTRVVTYLIMRYLQTSSLNLRSLWDTKIVTVLEMFKKAVLHTRRTQGERFPCWTQYFIYRR